MAQNGRLSPAELASIPGGQLAIEAAAAWNAPGGPADANLLPTGPESSYRTYDGQVRQRNYWCGHGSCGMAAVPGTSNHGLGLCVDLKEPWMRKWIDEQGAKYGWRKTEAMTEWWHVNFVGGVHFPSFELVKKGSRGKRVARLTKRLAFIHEPGGEAMLDRWYWRFNEPVEDAVRKFQGQQELEVDGVIGPKTAARIHAVFHRQYEERGRKELKQRWSLLWAARFVAKWEGFLPNAYLDTIASPPVWTIGYGHTHGVRSGQVVTEREARKLLAADLRDSARTVAQEVKVPLTVRQRIALISIVFNCGPGALDDTHLVRDLNAGRYKDAADRFLEWDHAGGVKVEGLTRRRESERWMFLHDGRKANQVKGAPHAQITGKPRAAASTGGVSPG